MLKVIDTTLIKTLGEMARKRKSLRSIRESQGDRKGRNKRPPERASKNSCSKADHGDKAGNEASDCAEECLGILNSVCDY